MEPCGILDDDKSKIIEKLVDKRLKEMEQSTFCIITNADKDKIREEIKDELFLNTGNVL